MHETRPCLGRSGRETQNWQCTMCRDSPVIVGMVKGYLKDCFPTKNNNKKQNKKLRYYLIHLKV